MTNLNSLMANYNEKSFKCIPLVLQRGEKEHVLVVQDETVFHTNKYCQRVWLVQDQQPIRKKGSGHMIHVSDFISEMISQIKLSEEQINEQLNLPDGLCLTTFEAQKITYLRKGFDSWWDLSQLVKQVKDTLAIFEYTYPNTTAVFVFDRSSAHGSYAEDALNINSMNIKPGEKQKKLHDTIIPHNNLDPAPGEEDTCGQLQQMCFPNDHKDLKLRRQPKGVKAVLQEQKSV